MYNTYGTDESNMFEITGEIRTADGAWTNVTMILDDDSAGHQLVSELIGKFEWRNLKQSESFGAVNIEKW